MPAYAEQVLVSTGKSDWTSKIEDDPEGELVRQLRTIIGPKGKYSDVRLASDRSISSTNPR